MSSLAVAFYNADSDIIEPNTIVVFGGERDVQVSSISHDPRVAGISIDPTIDAELTLTNFGSNACSVFAVTGLVDCAVQGPIAKGECVVTSDLRGIGQALDVKKYIPGCVLGKTLDAIEDASVQIIRVAVGIN
jgi:hypothetical protein